LSVSTNGKDNILEVGGLRTYFFTEDGVVKAVDGVDLEVRRGEILGLVGESGCGKSVTSFSIMRLVSMPGQIVDGNITFDGQDLLGLPESEMTHIRGNRISMIFQQPTGCLNTPSSRSATRSARCWTFTKAWARRPAGNGPSS
jgi:ABC-type dipeptide/oligopeptide/nickel transport system ATPase component